jgi:hypothetical protein
MLNLLQIVVATICKLVIILATIIIKFIPIIIISQSLILFLFAFLLLLRAIGTFLKFLVEK